MKSSHKHYFSEVDEIKDLKLIEDVIRGYKLKFYTSKNVFSREKVDEGTKLLANTMIIFEDSKVLDLGCGYGVLGIVASKIGCKEVIFIDINPVALKLTEMNCRINNINNFRIIKNDVLRGIKEKFDIIVTNPPYTAGKDIVERFIRESFEHLNGKGLFEFVVPNKFSKRWKDYTKNIFGNIEEISKNQKYVCYLSIKSF